MLAFQTEVRQLWKAAMPPNNDGWNKSLSPIAPCRKLAGDSPCDVITQNSPRAGMQQGYAGSGGYVGSPLSHLRNSKPKLLVAQKETNAPYFLSRLSPFSLSPFSFFSSALRFSSSALRCSSSAAFAEASASAEAEASASALRRSSSHS